MDFHLEQSGSTKGPKETGASEAAVYPTQMTASPHCCLPRLNGMKPTNVAPSYCPMFSFKAPVWESSLKEVSDQSEMLLSVANPHPGLEDHMYGS